MAGKNANGEGSVFKRTRNGKTRWYCEIVMGWNEDGTKKILRHSGETRKEVNDWRTKRLAEKQAGTLAEPTKDTVERFLDDWLKKTAPMQVGPSTLRLYRNMTDWYIRPTLGKVLLAQLQPKQIQALFHELLEAGKSPRTVQLVRVVLRRAFQQAVEWNQLSRNPIDVVKAPRVEHKEMQALTPDQIPAFLQAAKSERLHALFILAITTGMRKGEILGLRWQDVDLAVGKVSVTQTMKVELLVDEETGRRSEHWTFGQTKTKSSRRTIDLPRIAVGALNRWRKEQEWERHAAGEAWKDSDLVFTSEVGSPVHPKNLRDRDFHRVLKKAGLPLIRFHDLRHSFATFMAVQGVSDRVMQDVLGHSHINITKSLYVHVLQGQKKEAAEKVDTFLATRDKKAR